MTPHENCSAEGAYLDAIDGVCLDGTRSEGGPETALSARVYRILAEDRGYFTACSPSSG